MAGRRGPVGGVVAGPVPDPTGGRPTAGPAGVVRPSRRHRPRIGRRRRAARPARRRTTGDLVRPARGRTSGGSVRPVRCEPSGGAVVPAGRVRRGGPARPAGRVRRGSPARPARWAASDDPVRTAGRGVSGGHDGQRHGGAVRRFIRSTAGRAD
ncbi:hypothetical protein CA850_05920 [Micromonospora echinospora]|nr:hypothetical protein CA850_05920 [Micromonospora echinospora]